MEEQRAGAVREDIHISGDLNWALKGVRKTKGYQAGQP